MPWLCFPDAPGFAQWQMMPIWGASNRGTRLGGPRLRTIVVLFLDGGLPSVPLCAENMKEIDAAVGIWPVQRAPKQLPKAATRDSLEAKSARRVP